MRLGDSAGIRTSLRHARKLTPPLSFRRDWVAVIGILLVAAVVRIVPFLTGGGFAANYERSDEGIYMGAAIALENGVLPYRDYLLLHPPGIVVALSPFALIGGIVGDATAIGAARVAACLLSVANVALVMALAGRHGRIAGLLAGLVYALWRPSLEPERFPDLHTIQAFLLLAALVVVGSRARVSRRLAVVTGALIGLAVAVQLWQGITVAVLCLWAFARRPHGCSWWSPRAPHVLLGLSAIASFLAVCLPFAATDLVATIRYVILDQASRPRTLQSITERLSTIMGLPFDGLPTDGVTGLVVAIVVLVLFGTLVGGTVWTARILPWTRPWAALAAAQIGFQLAMPSFIVDYANFSAQALAALFGTMAAVVVAQAAARRAEPAAWPAVAVAGAAVAAVVVVRLLIANPALPVPMEKLAADTVAAPGCVAARRTVLLVTTGALRRNLAADCPVVLDLTGYLLHLELGSQLTGDAGTDRRDSEPYQQAFRELVLRSSMYLELGKAGDVSAATREIMKEALPFTWRRGAVLVWSSEPGK